MAFAGKACAAPIAARHRRPRGCGCEDLVAGEQQDRKPVVGVERGEVFVPRPLDIEILTE
jgi:hypothetical protein